jgi:predicted ArsR family transcriptional regulator
VKGLVAALGVSENAVRLRMNALVKSGQIQMHGARRTLRYFLVEDSGSE